MKHKCGSSKQAKSHLNHSNFVKKILLDITRADAAIDLRFNFIMIIIIIININIMLI